MISAQVVFGYDNRQLEGPDRIHEEYLVSKHAMYMEIINWHIYWTKHFIARKSVQKGVHYSIECRQPKRVETSSESKAALDRYTCKVYSHTSRIFSYWKTDDLNHI